jgi:hypothetical protein
LYAPFWSLLCWRRSASKICGKYATVVALRTKNGNFVCLV